MRKTAAGFSASGDALLSGAVKKKLPKPLGYGAGRLRETDSFAVFVPDAAKLNEEGRRTLQQVCDEKLPETGSVIAAGVYPGGEVKSLIKAVDSGQTGPAVLLDTVFHGQRLYIERTADKMQLSLLFQIDEQQVTLPLCGDVSACLVIFCEDGIRFTEKPTSSVHCFPAAIIRPTVMKSVCRMRTFT